MVTPRPADEHQRQLLQVVWDLFHARLRWPTFAEVDRRLDRMCDLDAVQLLQTAPRGLLYGVNLSGPPQDETQIGLTVAGAAACTGSEEDLRLFVAAVRRAAWLEQHWPGPPIEPEPTLTPAEVGKEVVVLPAAGREVLLERLAALLAVEQWGSTHHGRDEHGRWWFGIGREVRRFRDVQDVDDYLARQAANPASTGQVTATKAKEETTIPTPETVFLVHGHDEAAKYQVARVLRQLTGTEPVILDEQASRGRTLVEKFEQHANSARYAVVLLTPDDVGGPQDGAPHPRARQNVVFELGYFVGALGRGYVAVLNNGVERPSDIDGLVYIPYPIGHWSVRLGKEMQAAGVTVDLNQLR